MSSEGEIFGGIEVSTDCNDAETLVHALEACYSCEANDYAPICHSSEPKRISVSELLSTIRGPWALIYWQASSRKIWFGRGAFGRRSLLVHWPTLHGPWFLLCSASPPSSVKQNPRLTILLDIKRHIWTDSLLKELIKWERTSVEPRPHDAFENHFIKEKKSPMDISASLKNLSEPILIEHKVILPAQKVLVALRKFIMKRFAVHAILQAEKCMSEKD